MIFFSQYVNKEVDEMYIGVQELMNNLPDIKLEEAKRIIKDCRVKMKEDGYYVPNARRLLALKEYVEKYLGIKF